MFGALFLCIHGVSLARVTTLATDCIKTVTVSVPDDSVLNIRTEAKSSATLIGTVYPGDILQYTEKTNGNWISVKFGDADGWVSKGVEKEYVKFSSGCVFYPTEKVSALTDLIVMTEKSDTSNVAAKVAAGEMIQVSEEMEGDWIYVMYTNSNLTLNFGWARTKLLSWYPGFSPAYDHAIPYHSLKKIFTVILELSFSYTLYVL